MKLGVRDNCKVLIITKAMFLCFFFIFLTLSFSYGLSVLSNLPLKHRRSEYERAGETEIETLSDREEERKRERERNE